MSTAELCSVAAKFDVNFGEFLVYYPDTAVYACDVLLCPDDDGGFSAHCLNLRGVVSQGDDEADAISNIRDAFRETVLYYRDKGQQIPFGIVDVERTPNCIIKKIDVSI